MAALLSAAAIVMTGMTATSALAGSVRDTSCIGDWHSFSCVTQSGPARDPYIRQVPQTTDNATKARVAARERRWLARCRPIIIHDAYGIARYRYAASRCEFGVGED